MTEIGIQDSPIKDRILFISCKYDLVFVLIIYSLLFLLLINNYLYSFTPDGLSYISIAKLYVNGDWQNAINGYWGPLYSWLLTPFLLIDSTPIYVLFASKILSLIIGIITLIGINKLFSIFNIDSTTKTIMLFGLIPLMLYFSLVFITPDLLITCVLLYYLIFILSPDYTNKLSYGVFCGFLGAMAYLSKSYGFPFFLAHFILFNLIYFFKKANASKRKTILKNFFLGLSVFLIISGLWTVLISDKYGEFTIGTSSEYNQALLYPGGVQHAMDFQGLLTPPNNNAVSAWEDPSYFKMKTWSPFDSQESFIYYLTRIEWSIISLFNMLSVFSVLSIVIVILSLVFLFLRIEWDLKEKILYLLVTMSIYSFGYCLILVEDRYIWLVVILLMVTGAYLVNIGFKNKFFNKHVKNLLLILLVLSTLYVPATTSIENVMSWDEMYDLSKTIEAYGVHGNIASNMNWPHTLSIAYYLNLNYYGMPKKTDNLKDLEKELKSNSIDYYFVWGTSNGLQSLGYKDITEGKIYDLKIYAISF